jgi:hypothetical protein
MAQTPLEKFDQWRREKPEDIERAAKMAGLTMAQANEEIISIRCWLDANEKNKKANKQLWYKFTVGWFRRSAQRRANSYGVKSSYRKPISTFSGKKSGRRSM